MLHLWHLNSRLDLLDDRHNCICGISTVFWIFWLVDTCLLCDNALDLHGLLNRFGHFRIGWSLSTKLHVSVMRASALGECGMVVLAGKINKTVSQLSNRRDVGRRKFYRNIPRSSRPQYLRCALAIWWRWSACFSVTQRLQAFALDRELLSLFFVRHSDKLKAVLFEE